MSQDDAITRSLALAARHLNAALREPIPDALLLRAIRGEEIAARFRPHLKAFYDETDLTVLADLVLSGAVGWADLSRGAASCLRPDHATRIWIDERAGFKLV